LNLILFNVEILYDHFPRDEMELNPYFLLFIHGKNNFAEASKNLVKYRSENYFAWIIERLYRMFKLVARTIC